ncbi:MAG: 5-formyltetrahydrofolate cyclo-ligase [Burkholderiales bacterium]
MTDALRAQKKTLRTHILAARDALAPAARAAAGARALERVTALDAWRSARCVMAYLSFGSELDTTGFVRDTLARGARLALPRINADTGEIDPLAVADPARETVPGKWGLREPDPARCAAVALADIDFVLLPGVAFTVNGKRLGYGRGYYDRLIARFPARPVLVAAAFEVQILPDLPTGPADQRADLIVTEKDAYLAC